MYELKQLDVNLLQAARAQWKAQLDVLGEEAIPFQNKLAKRFGYDLNRYGNWLQISI